MDVLVVGGAGYIGSVTVAAMLDAGHQVTVFDDLEAGHREAVDSRARLIEGTTRSTADLAGAFVRPVDAVVHFAAYLAVGESMIDPGRYFENNVAGSIVLLNAALHHGVRRFVFSSSAAVFGDPEYVPIDERHPVRPTSPYGESKLIVEQMLRWYGERKGLNYVALRYFNAAGATERLGEDHDPETHLIPIILQVAQGKRPSLPLFGTDYPTADGTCIRDYVHVADLALAHVLALDYAADRSGKFNLGCGHGYSNREVIETARRVTGHPIPVDVQPRRAGDPPALVASSTRAREQLGWRPQFEDLTAIVACAWRWQQAHPQGYAAERGAK